MRDSVDTLASALVPELEPLGLELFDVELTGSGRARVLQVLVDKDGGVDLEAITAATERISPVLDALDVVSGPFALEVSSPGVERPLRRPEHYRRRDRRDRLGEGRARAAPTSAGCAAS